MLATMSMSVLVIWGLGVISKGCDVAYRHVHILCYMLIWRLGGFDRRCLCFSCAFGH